jgi:hypothetical protein
MKIEARHPRTPRVRMLKDASSENTPAAGRWKMPNAGAEILPHRRLVPTGDSSALHCEKPIQNSKARSLILPSTILVLGNFQHCP